LKLQIVFFGFSQGRFEPTLGFVGTTSFMLPEETAERQHYPAAMVCGR
jgi:hypothetical protein